MLRGPAHVSKLRARRRLRAVFLLGAFFGLLLLCLGGSLWLSYAPQLEVREIQVRGHSTLAEEDMRAFAENLAEEKYWGLLPKRNVFLYPKRTLEERLLSSFPKLLSVEVSLEDFHRLSIVVEERTPLALWCGHSKEERGECLFLDREGYTYAPAPEFSGVVFVRYFGALKGEVGTQFLTEREFRSVAALVAELGSHGEPSDVEITTDGDAQVSFIEGFKVFFALKDRSEDILERFRLVLEAEPLKGGGLEKISYVDLRFGDRVVYTFK